MSFTNFRKKSSRSFLAFLIVLFSAALFAFNAIGSSAQSLFDEASRQESFFSFSREIKPPQKKIKDIKDSPVFAEFENWIEQDKNRNFDNVSQHNQLGEELAIRRRELFKNLIRQNPRAALDKAISPEIYESLPPFIAGHLEKRISANGDFLVYTIESDRATGEMTEASLGRQVVIGESRYKAFVYGRRETMTTKLDIPLQGVVLDDLMVVDESPVRRIDSAEYNVGAVDAPDSDAAAEVGGKVVRFSNQSELDNFVNEQVEWESTIGPVRSKENSEQRSSSAEQTAPSWTQGIKKVLFIRAAFSDKSGGDPLDRQGNPLTATRAQNLINNEVNQFYVNNSYGKTSLQATATQQVVRLPQPQSFYTNDDNFLALIEDARVAARAAGYETNNYDFDIIGFSFTKDFAWDGNSIVAQKGNVLNGAFYLPEAAHELGHNYGLLHADLWRTNDGTVIGSGRHIETGDCYDVMGLNSSCPAQGLYSHFNARYKRLLDWLTDPTDVKTVTETGTYPLYAQDINSPAGGVRALKIKKDDTRNYWVEFRQLSPGSAMNGVLIRWDYASQEFHETELLDMTPATGTKGDEVLLIGQPFIDVESGIKITVVKKNGTAPVESVDVKVEINKIVNCAYTLTTSSIFLPATGNDGGTINVTAQSGCGWTATSNNSWITVPSGSGGTGNGAVTFSVARNDGAERTGTISVAEHIFYVTQATGSCADSISPTTFNVPANGGALSITHGCSSLTVTSTDSSWININTNPVTVSANTGAARSGIVRVSAVDINGMTITKNLTVIQSGNQPTQCSYSLSSTGAAVTANAETGSFNINTGGSGCNWTAVSNDSWITITSGASGNSSGTVTFTATANSGAVRTGSISAAGQIFTVTQAAGKSRKRTRFF